MHKVQALVTVDQQDKQGGNRTVMPNYELIIKNGQFDDGEQIVNWTPPVKAGGITWEQLTAKLWSISSQTTVEFFVQWFGEFVYVCLSPKTQRIHSVIL